MISTKLSDQIFRPLIPAACVSFRRPITTKSKLLPYSRPKSLKLRHLAQNSKWAIRLSLVDQSPPKSTFDVERLVGFLYEDLVHLFDDQGIDRTACDERVKFRYPITKHETVTGYLLNIAFLKIVFMPKFQLHWVKQDRITMHVLIPLVRKYAPYVVVQGSADKLSGSAGFGHVTGYIFGKNSKMEKIAMTTPVFTEASDAELSKVSIKICLPLDKDISSLPDPNQETISLKKVEEGIVQF